MTVWSGEGVSVILRDELDSLWHSTFKIRQKSQTNQRELHQDSRAVCVRLIVTGKMILCVIGPY